MMLNNVISCLRCCVHIHRYHCKFVMPFSKAPRQYYSHSLLISLNKYLFRKPNQRFGAPTIALCVFVKIVKFSRVLRTIVHFLFLFVCLFVCSSRSNFTQPEATVSKQSLILSTSSMQLRATYATHATKPTNKDRLGRRPNKKKT